jgi:hypothetical protein
VAPNVTGGSYLWFRVDDGAILGDRHLPEADDPIFLTDDRLLVPQYESVTLLDLRSGRWMRIPQALLGGRVTGFRLAAEAGGHGLHALRRPDCEGCFQVIRIDLAGLLDPQT